jgi:hypothetical protein
MTNTIITMLFWFLVLGCFFIQARFINLPLTTVPVLALSASWIFVISERRKILKREIEIIRSSIKKKKGAV